MNFSAGLLLLFSFVAVTVSSHTFLDRSKQLPEKLIVGYASWSQCDESLVTAVKQGVNVLIWFAISFAVDSSGAPIVSGGPDLECVKKVKQEISDLNLPTVHLISVGGWDAPHPETSNSPQSIYESWKSWNDGLFDGLDWDIEGNDDLSSPYNHFTIDCLRVMGEVSQLAKKDGFIVSLVPAESYLDPVVDQFNLNLTNTYSEWNSLQPNFTYHGRNVYSYFLLFYGTVERNSEVVDTFDFVTIQFYESFSHAAYNTTILHQPAADYLEKISKQYYSGWSLTIQPPQHFLGESNDLFRVSVPKTKLVLGLANGWAIQGKVFFVYPEQCEIAYNSLNQQSLSPRGFAFWDIADEGRSLSYGLEKPIWMAAGLNKFLKTREKV